MLKTDLGQALSKQAFLNMVVKDRGNGTFFIHGDSKNCDFKKEIMGERICE